MKRRTLLTAGIGLPLAACGGILPKPKPPPQLFRLTPLAETETGARPVNAALVVDPPNAAAALDTERIALSPASLRIDYFADAAWTDRAPAMVQSLVIRSLANAGRIRVVAGPSAAFNPDAILAIDLNRFEARYQDGGLPEATIALSCRLVRMANRSVIAVRDFEGTAKAARNETPDVVAAFDDAFHIVMRALAPWTAELAGDRGTVSAVADLAHIGRSTLEAMMEGGEAALACERALTRSAGSILAAAIEGAKPCVEWQHYPAGDVYDPHSHAQFFYHAHPPAERGTDEHGHFHTFLRAGGMQAGVRPLVLPELAIAGTAAAPATPSAPEPHAGEDGEWCHLVAIAMNEDGRPIRLFTTNRWVTGETWYRGEDVVAMLDRFALGPVGFQPLLNRWVEAMIAAFRPQIAALVAMRDETVMGWRRRRRGKVHVFEDRRLDVTSALDISLEAQLRAIETALERAA